MMTERERQIERDDEEVQALLHGALPNQRHSRKNERLWSEDETRRRYRAWMGLPAENELDEQAYDRAKDEVHDR
jgi:hypothetical protein